MYDDINEILEHLFTTENPETGSKPPKIAWAIFSNGTIFYSTAEDDLPEEASHEDIKQRALKELQKYGEVIVGSPAGDFNPAILDQWFPDRFVCFVSYESPKLVSIVTGVPTTPIAAGMVARSLRQADFENPQIDLVRCFNGETQINPDIEDDE